MCKKRTISLGIHIGHDSACAIAIDGKIVAAVQQERITRVKYDGQNLLHNHVPIESVLNTAGIHIEDVDWIISSFQSAAPGGIGLDRRIVDIGFNHFDVNSDRHLVISHHLAHAYSTIGTSGFEDCAVLICDLAGSSTLSGDDYVTPFSEWSTWLTSLNNQQTVLTECMSIYEWRSGQATLKAREYVTPHSEPNCFIFSTASLYDNVSQSLFSCSNAYGQLMALSAFGKPDITSILKPSDICTIENEKVIWRNDWQIKASTTIGHFQMAANVAHVIQQCTEDSILAYSRKAANLIDSTSIALAGGLFLNINANTRIFESGLFKSVHVPSAPNDAGIAIGCAMYGQLIESRDVKFTLCQDDRLGPIYREEDILHALHSRRFFIETCSINLTQISEALFKGEIIARWQGRSEFGPRALGGRSILGSPLLSETKDRLNKIKSRQVWRPVAPIVIRDRIEDFFFGPPDSPFMSYLHTIRPEYRHQLKALSHPDFSTRVQSLYFENDPQLFELLTKFEAISGYPILVNTSFNGSNQPIVECLEEAIDFYLANPEIASLIISEHQIVRLSPWENNELLSYEFKIADDVMMGEFTRLGQSEKRLYRRSKSVLLSDQLFTIIKKWNSKITIQSALQKLGGRDTPTAAELYDLLIQQCWFCMQKSTL